MTAESSTGKAFLRPQSIHELDRVKVALALAGHQVHDGDNRDFLVVHMSWGHSRYCPDAKAWPGSANN